ncbi:MAG: hypothetical protein MUF08_00245, partial [Burkholderiaceae bacterium]|nr:hypothetical protein [Burkholderiaceae bacterium]MCU0963500.1 hypothetical protein [Burkholderiaceae bacterium]
GPSRGHLHFAPTDHYSKTATSPANSGGFTPAPTIAGQLPSEGQSAAFKEFVWRFVKMMARALVPDIQGSVLDAAVWFVAHGVVWKPSYDLARARDEAALGRTACQRA